MILVLEGKNEEQCTYCHSRAHVRVLYRQYCLEHYRKLDIKEIVDMLAEKHPDEYEEL